MSVVQSNRSKMSTPLLPSLCFLEQVQMYPSITVLALNLDPDEQKSLGPQCLQTINPSGSQIRRRKTKVVGLQKISVAKKE